MHTPSDGLFGRDRELDEADRALATTASGEPQALLIGGDAGIGKTTFVHALGQRARERGFAVLTRSEERRVGKECRSRWSPYH